MTGYAPYGWLIIRDLITDGTDPKGTNCNAPGVRGPHGLHPDVETRLVAAAKLGKRRGTLADPNVEFFRMYDDDGNLYYTGCYLVTDDTDPDGFEPLDDFGRPNAGCTRIDYFRGITDGKEAWAEL